MIDYDFQGRVNEVTIADPSNGAILDTRPITGHVLIFFQHHQRPQRQSHLLRPARRSPARPRSKLARPCSTGVLASYSQNYSFSGHKQSVMEGSRSAANYTYDSIYRLTNESIASDSGGVNGTLRYSLDAVANRLNLTSTLAALPYPCYIVSLTRPPW